MTSTRVLRTKWEVTADRLRVHLDADADLLEGQDRDDIGHVIHLLERIQDARVLRTVATTRNVR